MNDRKKKKEAEKKSGEVENRTLMHTYQGVAPAPPGLPPDWPKIGTGAAPPYCACVV